MNNKYNKKKYENKKKRESSSIINIRNFHNWIKSEMLAECCTYIRKDKGIKNIALLDLAVGRGGDMFKWKSNDIKLVMGFDIDYESIHGENGAIDRYNKNIKKYNDYND